MTTIVPAGAAWRSLVALSDTGDGTHAVSASGVRVLTSDERSLLCATSGLWNVNFGYGQKTITAAIAKALQDASYLSLFRTGHRWADDAAARLVTACGEERFSKVIFSTSGGAANDLTMKLLRQAAQLRGERVKRVVVGLKGSYHGLTYGSHGLSGESLGQDVYAIDQRHVRHVDSVDPDEFITLCEREGDRICALVMEPVLGTGALEVPAEFLAVAFELADTYGFDIVADEVATGYFRTGPFLASSQWSRRPDVVILSKALTNGTCAAAAVVVSRDIVDLFEAEKAVFVHGETQAGTPPTCAAVSATLDLVADMDAVALAKDVSSMLDRGLAWLAAEFGTALTTSGVGCFRGLRLNHRGEPLGMRQTELVAVIRGHGVIVQPGLDGIQLVPALTYTESDGEELFAAVRSGIGEILSRW